MQIDVLRAFLVVLQEGSVNRAAVRLHVGQPALTRQMLALESEIGTRLLERSARGVAPTAAGQAFARSLRDPLAQLDQAIVSCRRFGRGERSVLRIGYLQSLARSYVNPALAAVRSAHPHVKVELTDMCSGGQIRALQAGEIDLGLIGHEGRLLAQDFYTRKICTVRVVAALPEDHLLAVRPALRLADLRREFFVGKDAIEAPGHNDWIMRMCRQAGFRPRFVRHAMSTSEMLSLAVSEGAVALLPEFAADHAAAGVATLPIQDAIATWDLIVAWQRGQLATPVKAFLAALPTTVLGRRTVLKSA
jgi:DNA-binding transcriptional LysR family regulator